ncbi:hypothetical protein AAVH_19340 [Aphelenchoides avenae]|nr:hypothetical protein AAVH_19340 [Aphelenchus avenae]
MASTGCAATLLPGGRTVHNVFAIPVPTFSDSVSPVNALRPPQELKEAKVLIIDEAPMLLKYILVAVDQKLREIHLTPNVPFGGVVMLLGGDFAQCLPVRPGASQAQLIDVSIRRSYLWPHFASRTFTLTQNMRARQDPAFVARLRSIGKGDSFLGNIGDEPMDGMLSGGKLVDEIYRKVLRGNLSRPQLLRYLAERCILSPMNKVCRGYNEEITVGIPGNFRYYHSIDAVAEDTANQGIDVPADVLNKVDVSGLPPHELALKVGSVVIMIRNLDVRNGMVNGQRFLVTKMSENCVRVTFLAGSRVGQTAFVHRVKLYSDDQDYPVKFSRHQFPVKH